MDLLQAMKERHSVRSYDEKSIEAGTVEKLRSFIKECNKESGLHMQLVLDEPHAFEGFMAHYGKFSGVRNYIALIGPDGVKRHLHILDQHTVSSFFSLLGCSLT